MSEPVDLDALAACVPHLHGYVEDNGGDHDDDCPGDDTCECSCKPRNDAVNAICNALPTMITELQALRRVRLALERLVGASSREELEAMRVVMGAMPQIADVQASMGAVDALLMLNGSHS